MNRQEFFQKISPFVSPDDLAKVSQAYWLAKETHRSQQRDNGERYFEHCRRVACVLAERGGTNADEIVIALLHDCEEDGFIPQELLEKLFGRAVAVAVDTLSKTTPIYDQATGVIKIKQGKNSEEYFTTIAQAPPWVRRIKLADRLDNLQSMAGSNWTRERKQKYIIETEKYILPIARLTDEWFFQELEKICSSFPDPFVYIESSTSCPTIH